MFKRRAQFAIQASRSLEESKWQLVAKEDSNPVSDDEKSADVCTGLLMMA